MQRRQDLGRATFRAFHRSSSRLTLNQQTTVEDEEPFTGHEFHLTNGETAIIESSDATGDGAPYGICFQPMSALVEHASKYPIVQRLNVQAFPFDFALTDLFGDDTCVTQTQLALPLLSAVFTTQYAVSIFTDMMVAFFENPLSTEPIHGSSENDGAASWTDSWAIGPRGPITTGGSADAVESNDGDDEPIHSLAGSDCTDDDAASTLGNDEDEFDDAVSPDSPPQPCYRIPHDLTCSYDRETIQLMFPEVAVTTPSTEAPAVAPSMLTVQRLRQ